MAAQVGGLALTFGPLLRRVEPPPNRWSGAGTVANPRLVLLVNLGARLGLAPIDRTRLEQKPEPKPARF